MRTFAVASGLAAVAVGLAAPSVAPGESSFSAGRGGLVPAGPSVVPCDPGGTNEPYANATTSYSTTHMYAHVDTTAPVGGAAGDYYEAYVKLFDQSFSRYIEIYVKRSPNDQGTLTVSARSFDGATTHPGLTDYLTTAPNLELRYNSFNGFWEAYDGVGADLGN